jgi:phosphatidate phosphatase APP1
MKGFIRDIKNFLAGKEYTKEQKVGQITSLMENLPGRKFTLIGDSGELDPEVFTQLREERPAQVSKILIRDIVDARRNAPDRLLKVDEVIDAPIVLRGKSHFA